MGRTGGCGKKESKHPRAGDLSGWCSDCECNTRQPQRWNNSLLRSGKLCIVVRMKEHMGLWKARGGVWPCAMTGLGLGKAPRPKGVWQGKLLVSFFPSANCAGAGCELADCQGVPAGGPHPGLGAVRDAQSYLSHGRLLCCRLGFSHRN